MTISPKRLVVVADDYGISPAVSLGIRELAAKGRLSATGAMTLMPSWPAEAPALRAMGPVLDVGLHFTLTDQVPLGPMPSLAPAGRLPPVATLLRRALAGAVPAAEVAAELDRQLDAFEAAMGRPPDFVDGHQHVHLFKGVRGAVLAAFGRRLDPARCWLRDCTDRVGALMARGSLPKALLISLLGEPLHRAARARGLVVNRGFSGFYGVGTEDFGRIWPRLLAGAGDGHLLMVHPGHVDDELARVDVLTTPREGEWRTFDAAAFPARLAELGFALTVGAKNWQTPRP